MNKEEFKESLNKVLETSGDPGKTSELLVEVYEKYNSYYDENTTKDEKIKTLEETNASLVKANGEMFKFVSYTKVDPATEQAVEVEEPSQPGIEDVMEKLINTWGAK